MKKYATQVNSSTLLIKTVKFQTPKSNYSFFLLFTFLKLCRLLVTLTLLISSLCFLAEHEFTYLHKKFKTKENPFWTCLTYFNMCWNSTWDTSLTEMVQYNQQDRPKLQTNHDAGSNCGFQKPGTVALWPLKCRLRSMPFLSHILLTQQANDCRIWKAILYQSFLLLQIK